MKTVIVQPIEKECQEGHIYLNRADGVAVMDTFNRAEFNKCKRQGWKIELQRVDKKGVSYGGILTAPYESISILKASRPKRETQKPTSTTRKTKIKKSNV